MPFQIIQFSLPPSAKSGDSARNPMMSEPKMASDRRPYTRRNVASFAILLASSRSDIFTPPRLCLPSRLSGPDAPSSSSVWSPALGRPGDERPSDLPVVPERVLDPAEAPAVLFDHGIRSEEHTSELQSRENLVCRLLLEKKKKKK